jgi:hypothetical protein
VAGLDVKAVGDTDSSMSITSAAQYRNATLFLGTPFNTSNPSRKCALIAEARNVYSKNRFHICINDVSDNDGSHATLADSKFSVDSSGVTIPIIKHASSAGIQLLGQNNTHLATFGATSGLYGSGNYVELDVNNHIRAKGTGNNRGRLYVVSNAAAGSEFYFGGGFSGSYVPDWSFFANPNGNLQIWRVGSPSESQFIDIDRTSGMVTFVGGHQNASDRSLKDNIEDMPEHDAINLLKTVSAKTYTRNDLNDGKRRAGFIAQDFQNAPITLGENIVGKTMHSTERGGAEQEMLTLGYDRTAVILWQCCRSMLARIEVLEAAAAS